MMKKKLVKELYEYYTEQNVLPSDFTTAFTAFCMGDEFKDMIVELEDNSFYLSMFRSFEISWKSNGTYYIEVKQEDASGGFNPDDFVVETSPLTFSFSDNKYTVGSCTFSLNRMEIISQIFKSGSYTNVIRIYVSVKNDSSETTYFSAAKTGNVVGTYHGKDGDIMVDGNDFIKWESRKKEQITKGCRLSKGEKKQICVQAVYITTEKLKYSDKPYIDF